MKELVNNMLAEIEVNISEIDLYGYNIVETFLSIVRRLQAVLNDLTVSYTHLTLPTTSRV